MTEPRSCCQTLSDAQSSASPFERVVALGFYDGPTAGFLGCSNCGREFRFWWLAVSEEPGSDEELRIFGLVEIPSGSIESFETAMAPYDRPSTPYWFPSWSFPSEEIRETMDSLVQSLSHAKSGKGIVVASREWPLGEIFASRGIPADEMSNGRDWFAFLGLTNAEVKG